MTQVFRKIKNDDDKQHLQNDLGKLVVWEMADIIKFWEMPTHRTQELGCKQ